jgi:hypothetical protein
VFTLRRHLRLHRWAATWLVALALLVRLLVPAGYMPMAGKAALEICAGQVMDMPALSAMPDMAGMPMKATGHGKPMSGEGEHVCAFAAVGGAVDLPTIILPPPPTFVVPAVPLVLQLLVRPGAGLAAPPPPKTGPPAILR